MIVVSFTDDSRSKDDFAAFARCVGGQHVVGSMCRAQSVTRFPLNPGWLDARPCSNAELAAVVA